MTPNIPQADLNALQAMHKREIEQAVRKAKAEANERNSRLMVATIGVVATIGLIALVVGIPLAWKSTKVWRLEQDGKAKLAEAMNATKVKTERARADLESSKLNAKAEVERARGTAKAVKIENGAITESYTNYLYVKNLSKANVIYVPTETGLPVLEAGKRSDG